MLRVNVTLPVCNEEAQLASSVSVLCRFLEAHCGFSWEVVIADNGSEDGTRAIAGSLTKQYPGLGLVHLDAKGRGRALKQVWGESEADILSYMDLDLSTDLAAFPTLVKALASGEFDLASGSRLLPGSVTRRSWRREAISRGYNWLVKLALATRFSDAQCGFKAITARAARLLLPAVADAGWFFDTELLLIAEKPGFRIFEAPVRWTEGRESRVKILGAAWEDLKGLARLRRGLRQGRYDHLVAPCEAEANHVL
jgi:glycosyltransferase involved in cell wall biosynthesis